MYRVLNKLVTNKIKLNIYSCMLAAILVSCSEPIQSIAYYRKHPDEINRVIKECASKSYGYRSDQNCKNADAAQAQIMFDGLFQGDSGL